MRNYILMTTEITIRPKGKAIFDEECTSIKVEDEASGAFVEITQVVSDSSMVIRLDVDEWPMIREGINKMVQIAQAYNKEIGEVEG